MKDLYIVCANPFSKHVFVFSCVASENIIHFGQVWNQTWRFVQPRKLTPPENEARGRYGISGLNKSGDCQHNGELVAYYTDSWTGTMLYGAEKCLRHDHDTWRLGGGGGAKRFDVWRGQNDSPYTYATSLGHSYLFICHIYYMMLSYMYYLYD